MRRKAQREQNRKEDEMYDVIIIGSGPAGLSAAIYAKRASLKAVVLEQAPFSGGQMLNTYEVDNYLGFPGISGMELAAKMRAHADKLHVEFVTAKVTEASLMGNVKKVRTDREEYEAGHVIIATGAQHANLHVEGEERLTGKGVSYCATCDGAFFKNKSVAVVGGGDVAVEDALYLARICSKVYLIHRRDQLRAAGSLKERLSEEKNIEMYWNHVVEEIVGETAVESLRLRQVISGEKSTLAVQGVFIAVGNRPQTELFAGQVDADAAGYLIAGEDGRTSVEGVYAAGDVRAGHLHQIITAAADGANCINSIVER